MTLDFKKNTKTESVPCLPCCFGILDGCSCVDTSVNLKVHLFIKNLFIDHADCNAATRNDDYSNSGVASFMACGSSPEGTVFYATKTIVSPHHTYSAEIRRNNDGTWSGRINIDGAGFSAWESVTKTFSNEVMFRVEGTVSGYEILVHGFCLCTLQHNDGFNNYSDYYELSIPKRLYATINGLPSCFSSVTNSFSFVRTFGTPITPVTVGHCVGQISSNFNRFHLYSYDKMIQADQAAIICASGFPIFLFRFTAESAVYGTNISDPNYPVGTVRLLGPGSIILLGITQSQLDLSVPLTLDLNPFFMSGKSRLGGNWNETGPIDYSGVTSYLNDHPTFVEVTITE